MAERIRAINPDCDVQSIEEFVTSENVSVMLDRDFGGHRCHRSGTRQGGDDRLLPPPQLPIVVAGAAGSQIDPTQIRVTDLSQTVQDLCGQSPLQLTPGARLHARCQEEVRRCSRLFHRTTSLSESNAVRYRPWPSPVLNCAGFGSSVCIFGFRHDRRRASHQSDRQGMSKPRKLRSRKAGAPAWNVVHIGEKRHPLQPFR
ncbi:MAG: hypothetical protein MZV65_38500 [Chromatiales bacterium]|nr:hypothetical protein [Chromatiales bacterium]